MSEDLPLEGLRVLDLTTVIMGPFTTQVLGDFGADIIKIEDPNGDMTRDIGPSRSDKMSSMYLGVNRNKRSIVLHGYREDGPYGGQPAFDDVIQGQSGIAGTFNARDGEPHIVPTVMADKSVGLLASTGLLAAYIKKLKTGKGSYLEVSMFEGMVGYTLIEHHFGETFIPSMGPIGYPRALSEHRKPYKSKDGYISILPYTNQQWVNFFTIIGREDLIEDERFSSIKARSKDINTLYNLVRKSVTKKTNKEWVEVLKKAEIPFGVVNRLEDLKQDPQLKTLGFFREYNHPSEGKLEVPDSAFRYNKKSLPVRRHQPKLGEQSEEILREAGFSSDEIYDIINC